MSLVLHCDMFCSQLLGLYTEIILSKIELEGRCRDSIEMFSAETFENYTEGM